MIAAWHIPLAQVLWDYHRLQHELRPADCLLVLGSNDLRVAKWAARVFLDGYAPMVVCSGGVAHGDDLLATGWDHAEARVFADTMRDLGVPLDVIAVEERSRNTGENYQFTQSLLASLGVSPATVIVAQKPFMERRAFATGKRWWPDKDLILTSPPCSLASYLADSDAPEDVIHVMVGDLQRVKLYAERGFQVPQEIPSAVWEAYERLVAAGFTKHLVQS